MSRRFADAVQNTYTELVDQTFHFPQEDFNVTDGYLRYNGFDLRHLIEKYGTPLKISYLPKIGMQINKAKDMFANALKSINTTALQLLLLHQELTFQFYSGRSVEVQYKYRNLFWVRY